MSEGAEAPSENEKLLTMNFADVDIRVLVEFISDLTGKNFLVDPSVKGNVTIISPGKVTVEEAYRVFLSVLEVHGFAIVPSGKINKIIKAGDAGSKGIATRSEKEGPGALDSIITQIYPLTHADASDMAKILKPLVPKTGLLIPYPDTNTLIIIDVQSNIHRLLQIVRELDWPGEDEKIEVFTLKYARAESLEPKLSSLFQTRRRRKVVTGSPMLKLISDERTNSLIVLGVPDRIADIRVIIDRLDQAESRPKENIHTYALEHAAAEDIAKVLTQIPERGATKKKGKTPLISKDVKISADKPTNTLVIIAELEEFQIMERIIKKLDVPRPMVYVEALILEVSASKALDLGVEWRVGDEYRGGLQSGGSGGVWTVGSSRGSKSGDIPKLVGGTLPAGFVAGVVGKAITLGNVTFPSISAFVRAVRTDSDFNVISTPQILTLDNEEAVIEVGQNIPYVTSVVEQGAALDRPIQNFEYRDIGVTLKVTPHISSNEFVKLEIEQSIKNVVDSVTEAGLLAPTTTYRTTKSTITVSAGETAVIGGLVETRINRGQTQTPCLGGIPGLGWAFKQVGDRDDKKNLLVFLSPHIIGTPDEGRTLYGDKKEYIDNEMEKALRKNESEEIRRRAFE